MYRFSHKDFGKAPDQNYPQAYNSTLRTNFYLGTKSKIFITKSVVHPIVQKLPLKRKKTYEIIEALALHGLPVLFHCGISYYNLC